MTAIRSSRSAARSSIAGASVVDAVLAALASTVMILLVTGHLGSPGRHGGAVAAICGLAMTLPVAWRRRAPAWAAAALLAGALLNVFGVGAMVRCGPGLPVVFLVAFSLGRREPKIANGLAGVVLLAGSLVLQVRYDPDIRSGGLPMMLVLSAIAFALCGAGRLLRGHVLMTDALEARTEELRRRRSDNAGLAVASERGRIADDINDAIGARLAEVVAAAAEGRGQIAERPDRADEIFGRIQRTARSALTDMRGTVGALLADPSAEPAPVLAELAGLAAREPGVRLIVDGAARPLSPGLELAAYRIVERLLGALEKGPHVPVDVRVRFSPDTLELAVVGPVRAPADAEAALAAARERAELHQGTVSAERTGRRWHAVAHLPLRLGPAGVSV